MVLFPCVGVKASGVGLAGELRSDEEVRPRVEPEVVPAVVVRPRVEVGPDVAVRPSLEVGPGVTVRPSIEVGPGVVVMIEVKRERG